MSGGSLVTLFWDLFSICNEPSAKVSDILVDGEICLSFRRCFDTNMMCRWRELCALLGFVSLSRDRDTPIWSVEASGKYSVRSFYNLVNDGGVRVPHLASIWKISIPGRVQVFMWLLVQNRLLTRDNLAKRRAVHDGSCLFCDENESVSHLFFECVVAKQIWLMLTEIFTGNHISSIDAMCHIWLASNSIFSITTAAFLWSLWKTRNNMCFQERQWSSLLTVWDRATSMLRRWRPLLKNQHSRLMERNLQLLDFKRGELLRIAWLT
jgi:hypothetical protein